MKNKVIAVVSILSIVLLLIIILIKQVPKTVQVTTFERAYNIVKFSEEEFIEIPIYVNYLDAYLVKKDNITSININNEEESLAFKVDKISNTEEAVYLKNKKFYKYIFTLMPTIDLEEDFSIEINDAKLEINYLQGITVNLQIGSLSYYFYQNDDSSVTLNHLKGLINTYDDKVLVGVNIGLKNNTNKNIIINNITPLDLNLEAAVDEILINRTFDQGKKIDELLGYNYQLYNLSNTSNINIELDEEINIFVPLKYKSNILLNKTGFLVEYEVDGIIKYLCIDDFLFFETSLYSLNKINSLKYHTYENY